MSDFSQSEEFSNVKKENKNKIIEFFKWLFGPGPLFSIAATVAVYQGHDLLNEILKIQEQAKEIHSGVAKLRYAVELLEEHIKSLKFESTAKEFPALMKDRPSKEEIAEAIRSIPQTSSGMASAIYLPANRFDATVEKIHEASSLGERKAIFKQALEYNSMETFMDSAN